MSRFIAAIIPFILIVLLVAFFFFSPKLLPQLPTSDAGEVLKELFVKKFTSIGNSIAHAVFVEDAIIMEETAKLDEIVTNLQQDESDILFIYFTDYKNQIMSSSDSTMLGKVYQTDILSSGASTVKEKNGLFEAGFNINIGTKKVGALYFAAKPMIPNIASGNAPNKFVLGAGALVALLSFIITFASFGAIEKKVVHNINRRQQDVFLPKIEALKNEEVEAQKELDEINNKLAKMMNEYETKKKEIESSPVFQSVEMLKATETKVLKQLETLKDQEMKLSKELELLRQTRDETNSALEAEKKEESILHEKLALIKKKILRLETPEK